MIVTPGQLNLRADLYQQLGTLIRSGVSIHNAVGELARSRRGAVRHFLENLQASLNQGNSFFDSLSSQGTSWVPSFDLALLNAAEQSGRLDSCLVLLADYYRQQAAMTRELLNGLLYPAFLLHFAIFLLPFPQFFIAGNLFHYLCQTFGILIPIYAVVIGGIYVAQGSHGESWRAKMEDFIACIPVLHLARKNMALSRLAVSLEALLHAGVPIVQAWSLAAESSGSIRIKKLVEEWRAPMGAGETPAELVSASCYFPEIFSSQYRTAEMSGQLEETLHRLYEYYREESTLRIRMLVQWIPRLVYLIVAGWIAYKIISIYGGIINQLNSVMTIGIGF